MVTKVTEERKTKVYAPRAVTPYVVFDPRACTGCPELNEPMCVRSCRMDMIVPNPEKGKPPIVTYSDECCDCGCCVHACPRFLDGAIEMNWPLIQVVRWKRKETGQHFRLGMPNSPPANPEPPVSGWHPKILRP
jgi:Na+-translocating ferredoxin:NAD+ oxidoreductase RNF subunit RnfB